MGKFKDLIQDLQKFSGTLDGRKSWGLESGEVTLEDRENILIKHEYNKPEEDEFVDRLVENYYDTVTMLEEDDKNES